MAKLRTFFYVLRNSLLNLDYYREVKDMPFGFSLKYFYGLLLLIAAAVIIPFSLWLFSLSPKIPGFVANTKNELTESYPAELIIKLENGELSTNQNEPYFIDGSEKMKQFLKSPELNLEHLVTIDTKATATDYGKYQTLVLVTKKRIIYPQNADASEGTQTQSVDLEQMNNFTLTQSSYLMGINELTPILDRLPEILWIVVAGLLIIGPFVVALFMLLQKLLHLLIFSVAGVVVANLIGASLSYKQVYKIAIHASTIPTLFFTALFLLNLQPAIPLGYSLILLLFSGAVFYNLKSKSDK